MSAPRSRSTFGSFLSRTNSARPRTYIDVDHEHISALEALKQKLIATGHTTLPAALLINSDLDATLFRFLRARRYHVDHAFTMLEKSLQWRSKMGADHILEHPIDPVLQETVRECRPSSYIGFDRQHHPVFFERLGKIDGKRMEKEGASNELALSYHLREMEFMSQVVFAEASAAAGHTVDRVVSIMDASGLTLSALTGFAQRLLRLITAMDSDNYPECCDAIYIVNGGAAFAAIWRLVSPFIDKGTRDKVHVIGSGKAMQKVLFDTFGRELVPSFLGGDLDYEATRHEWLVKMDQAIAQRQLHPSQQSPVPVLTHAKPHSVQQQQHQQHGPAAHVHSQRSGPLQWLKTNVARSSISSDGEGWATPRSAASRFSTASGQSVYFDAQESSVEVPSPAPSSPTSTDSDHAPHQLAQHRHHGANSPEMAGSIAGSMSVGPQSRIRSQLSQQSGFTDATVGQGLGHGHHGVHGDGFGAVYLADHEHEQVEVGLQDRQPACGCRCVIC